MSAELIKYAFVAGELSPRFFGRGDLEKYDLGLALAYNWFVDYQGGISTRAGFEFCDFIMEDDQEIKTFEFSFSPDIADTYIIVFGHLYIRFIQDGAYVLEAAKTITGVTQANPGVVTSAAHGYATGDWVKIDGVVGMTQLNGRTFEIGATTANTFALLDPFGNNFNTTALTAYVSGGTASRIYTLVSPYAASELEMLRADQIRDTVRLTIDTRFVRNLTRNGHADWTLAVETFGTDAPRPGALTVTSHDDEASPSSGVIFGVTALMADGSESQLSPLSINTVVGGIDLNPGSYEVTWAAVEDAVGYNVYRSAIKRNGTVISASEPLGFVGRVLGPKFHDSNVLPDFTKTPPNHRDPFASAPIEHINITAGGAGYTNASTVTVTDVDGTGFIGYPIVSDGAVIAVVIVNGGSGYTAPSISFSVGAGATAVAVLGDLSESFPSVSATFQQRQVYAGTQSEPHTVFASRPGKLSNFDDSNIITGDDAYEHTIDAKSLAPIRHIVSSRGGLLLFTQVGISQLSANGEAVTATNALADPQSYAGASLLPPLTIDADILYVEGKGFTVRLLSYNDITKIYAGQDVSILSSHLFGRGRTLKSWDYAADPFKIAWAHREDGALLALTLVKEQDVFAWTQHWTRGAFRNTIVIQEGDTDSVYAVVERYVAGRWTKFFERMKDRRFSHIEEAFCVDCGLVLEATYPDARLFVTGSTGTVTCTASADVFSAGDVGKVLRVGGGKATVATYVGVREITATFVRDATAIIPGDTRLFPAESGAWTLDTPVSTVTGLWHLEGETVKVLADGNVLSDRVVANGSVTLDSPATRVAVGFGYQCVAQTLPTIANDAPIEGRRKRIVGTAVRIHDTRGLKAGTRLDALYEMKERTDEPYGEPTRAQEGMKYLGVEPVWDDHGQLYYVQDYPLPATVLGYVLDVEVGDDPD